jgi:quercetin dioxygenase-like cupin family protein
MAKTNDIIVNPVIGDKLKFLVTSSDSNGELLKVHLWNKAGAQGPPEHFHPNQNETFTILSGTVGFKCNGQEKILTAGQSITAQKGEMHKFWSIGDKPSEMIVEIRPALRSEFFLETWYSLAKNGKVKKDSTPRNFLQFMTILNEYSGEGFVAGPPILLQKIMSSIFGGLGKILGYKGFIPYERNESCLGSAETLESQSAF